MVIVLPSGATVMRLILVIFPLSLTVSTSVFLLSNFRETSVWLLGSPITAASVPSNLAAKFCPVGSL